LALGAAAGVPVCDAAGAFEPSFRYFYDDLHLNSAGAAHMADALAPCVVAALRRE
jgi:lysophospholipase L1-like esterase